MRIYLTGFMGSGKSFVGRRLAADRGLPFLDLDTFIEERAGLSITEVFAARGEAAFRSMESSALRQVSQLPMFVLATGGGTPCHDDNMAFMGSHGLTVFIDPVNDILVRRLRGERAHRPLLQGTEDLARLVDTKLASRRACYEKARFHVRQTNPKQDVVRLIANQLQLLDHSPSHE